MDFKLEQSTREEEGQRLKQEKSSLRQTKFVLTEGRIPRNFLQITETTGLAGHRLWGQGSESRPLRDPGQQQISSQHLTQEQRMLPVNPRSQGLFQKRSEVFTEKPQAGPVVTLI